MPACDIVIGLYPKGIPLTFQGAKTMGDAKRTTIPAKTRLLHRTHSPPEQQISF
jgi:hypothetical protein